MLIFYDGVLKIFIFNFRLIHFDIEVCDDFHYVKEFISMNSVQYKNNIWW